jgi:hypothetical protein
MAFDGVTDGVAVSAKPSLVGSPRVAFDGVTDGVAVGAKPSLVGSPRVAFDGVTDGVAVGAADGAAISSLSSSLPRLMLPHPPIWVIRELIVPETLVSQDFPQRPSQNLLIATVSSGTE